MTYKIPFEVSEVSLNYRSEVKAKDRPRVTCSLDASQILLSNWSDYMEMFEEFYILLLDRSSRVMGRYLVSQGSVAGTVVDPKDVFCAALKTRCSGLILAHNHPSGNLKPSSSDLDLTKKLIQGGDLLDIQILDHLILAPDGGYYSFADEGLL